MALSYDTYELLFYRSNKRGNSLGTSVSELMKRGIPSHKIVVGKPV